MFVAYEALAQRTDEILDTLTCEEASECQKQTRRKNIPISICILRGDGEIAAWELRMVAVFLFVFPG